MTTRYVARELRPRETAMAGAVGIVLGAAVGLTAFYLTRILLGRETLEALPAPTRSRRLGEPDDAGRIGAGGGEGGG